MKPESIVVLGTAPLGGPPLHEQRLAASFSQDLDLPVLHVDPPLSLASWVRTRRRVRPTIGGRGAVQAYQPLLPLPVERQRDRNARLLTRQVARAAARFPAPHLLLDARLSPEVKTPWAAGRVCILKDHNPAGAHLWNRDRADIERVVLGALAAADRCYGVTENLAEWAAANGHQGCAVIAHGWKPSSRPSSTPEDFGSLKRPILLFAGRIDGRLDFEALENLADSSTGSLVTIGPWLSSAEHDLQEHPRVHALPAVAPEDLAGYLEGADCLLLPYRSDEWSHYGLPAKLYEYLASGPPVVASGYTSLEAFLPPLIHYTSNGLLGDAVMDALKGDSEEARRARLACARSNPWSNRARDVLRLVEDL